MLVSNPKLDLLDVIEKVAEPPEARALANMLALVETTMALMEVEPQKPAALTEPTALV